MASNPFYFGGRISSPNQFVGREEAIRFIMQRMTGPQMTSVAVIGERRIGKSSLLYHIYQTYMQRIENGQRFLLAEASLQEAHVRDRAGFVSTVSERLQGALNRHPRATELPVWPHSYTDLTDLGSQLRELYDAGLRVVVCLDEFEELLENRRAFDNAFYDAMRALLDAQHLMLVIASTRPLTYYGQRYQLVSRFFNVTNSLNLGELNEDEARVLLTRPATFGGSRPALGAMDSQLALRLGGRHPFFSANGGALRF